MSMLPLASQATGTTFMPAMTALAGLVPCAETGMRQMRRLLLAARLVIGANGQQPGVFALRTGVGLKRNGGHAGDLRQPRFELPEERLVTARLVGRREGMQPARPWATRRGTSPPWR